MTQEKNGIGNQEPDRPGGDAQWPGVQDLQVTPGAAEFTLSDVLSDAMTVYKENFMVFVIASLINTVTLAATYKVPFVQLLFSPHFLVGMNLMGILAVRKIRNPEVGDFFSGFNAYLPVLLGGGLFLLALAVGFALLLVPGIYIYVTYFFTLNILAEDADKVKAGRLQPSEVDWMARFKDSERLAEGYKMKIFLYALVLNLISFSGMLLFGIGIIVTAPIGSIGWVILYERLRKVKGMSF